ncbi:MAG TPA: hypothetical protein VH062_26835 [Polyangiaceae bacterium]|jgi:hypothetical protein|nr:hypothetical protein [Polyangiaceae bacterium]
MTEMRGFRLDLFEVATAALLLVACAGETAPHGSADAATPASRADGGHPTSDAGDASRPAPCSACFDAGTDAARDARVVSVSNDAGRAMAEAGYAAADATLLDATPEASTDAGFRPPGYPGGRFGTAVGETFPYLRWVGYVGGGLDGGLVLDGPFTAYTSDDMRRSGKTLALFHIADFDCPGCNHAAIVLAGGARTAEEEGALVVEVLGSTQFTNPADKKHLDAWIQAYDLRTTTLIDEPGHELSTLDAIGIRETALVVELATMKVVFRMTGDLAGIGPSSLDSAFTYLHDHATP